MRLLKLEENGEFSLTKDITYPTMPYAILSHTWGEDDEEVNFRDLKDSSGKSKEGYRKLYFCGEQAARDGLQYFWIDSCCIDKSNSTELSEAINSMFRWYHNAARCYVYLTDVLTNNRTGLSPEPWEAPFQNSRWFTRGWTLQELIAPPSVEFFCPNGKRLGDKKSLERQLHMITGIPILGLRGSPLSDFSFDERVLWARNRDTKREEDLVYSLLGIFDISIPVIYGEGKENAFRRLKREWKYRLDELSQTTSNYTNQFGALQQTLGGNSDESRPLEIKSYDSDIKASSRWSTEDQTPPYRSTSRRTDNVDLELPATLEGHSHYVCAIAFSPDGKVLASGSGDMTVRLWDPATRACQATLEGHSHYVYAIAFSPDGKVLASGSWDRTVRLWDPATRACQATLEGHSDYVCAIAFSPDGKVLASGSWDMTVRLWDPAKVRRINF